MHRYTKHDVAAMVERCKAAGMFGPSTVLCVDKKPAATFYTIYNTNGLDVSLPTFHGAQDAHETLLLMLASYEIGRDRLGLRR